MEIKESKRCEKGLEIKNSDFKFRWKDFERVESFVSRTLINDINVYTFLDNFFELEDWKVIDIFPLPVPVESVFYEEVEKYFFENYLKNFISKCVRIITKLSCYYPYTHVIVGHNGFISDFDENLYDEKSGIYYGKPIEYQAEVISPIQTKKLKCFIKTVFETLSSPSIYFYFQSIDTMISLHHDQVISAVRFLHQNDEFLELLNFLVVSEGLFLRK